ncbi:hypothetical protein A8B78_06730 [Jannaschia sp. EhC01]|nr:hypothetical protein A8B78_06730 [Jannaschia sp. EhC01]
MAVFSTNVFSTSAAVKPQGRTWFARLDTLFTAIAKARTCAQEIEHLSALSDAQLEARGLTRQTLVRHAARAYL